MNSKYAKIITFFVAIVYVHICDDTDKTIEKKNYQNYIVVRLIPRNGRQLSFLKSLKKSHKVKYWQIPSKINHKVDVMVKPSFKRELYHQLSALKLNKRILIADVGRRIMLNRNIGLMRSLDGGFFSDFQKLSAIEKFIHNLTKKNSDIASILLIGKSLENRLLHVIKIGQKYNKNKPIVWIDSGIHAREWIAPSTACFIINKLIEEYRSGVKSTINLLKTVDFYILPVVNPDGYVFSHTNDRLWRKNRRLHTGMHDKEECDDGVDLNRNFDLKWNFNGYAKDHPCEEDFCGPIAFSEPESKAVAKFILAYKSRIKYYISLHSYGQYFFYPWGWTKEKPPHHKELHMKAKQAVNAIRKAYKTKYIIGQPSNLLYEAYGSSYDWAYGTAGIKYSYTIELRDAGEYGFLLPPTKIIPVGNETWIGIKAMVSDNPGSVQSSIKNRGSRLRYMKQFYGKRIG